MKEKEISFEDRKIIQLEMLKEIDSFCRLNNITYTLSCGTLIGAIRHGGYIPWDDDVDITMPYEDMLRFRESFVSETLKYCDIETEKYHGFHFSRIVHNKTYSKIGRFGKDYGICIDVYPVIECQKDAVILNDLLVKAQSLLDYRLKMIKWRNRIISRFPFVKNIPGYSKSIRGYYNFMTKRFVQKGSGSYYQLGGPLFGKSNNFYHNFWNFDPFEETIDIKFESLVLKAPARYDEFLKVRYGDYMKLPPEDQRQPYHGAHYYWK